MGAILRSKPQLLRFNGRALAEVPASRVGDGALRRRAAAKRGRGGLEAEPPTDIDREQILIEQNGE
jgi:hypothetical protein